MKKPKVRPIYCNKEIKDLVVILKKEKHIMPNALISEAVETYVKEKMPEYAYIFEKKA